MVRAIQIKDFPKYYITDGGDVYSRICRFRKLKLRNVKGYPMVVLRKNGKNFWRLVHRLVAKTYIPNPENKREVNHKDGNKTNNCVKNLEWVSSSENKFHAYKVLKQKGHLTNHFGKRHPKSKVILQIKNGKIINKFYGSCEAQRHTGVGFCGILMCCYGKLKTSGGFEWKFGK